MYGRMVYLIRRALRVESSKVLFLKEAGSLLWKRERDANKDDARDWTDVLNKMTHHFVV